MKPASINIAISSFEGLIVHVMISCSLSRPLKHHVYTSILSRPFHMPSFRLPFVVGAEETEHSLRADLLTDPRCLRRSCFQSMYRPQAGRHWQHPPRRFPKSAGKRQAAWAGCTAKYRQDCIVAKGRCCQFLENSYL